MRTFQSIIQHQQTLRDAHQVPKEFHTRKYVL
jgi:hypothetical protein